MNHKCIYEFSQGGHTYVISPTSRSLMPGKIPLNEKAVFLRASIQCYCEKKLNVWWRSDKESVGTQIRWSSMEPLTTVNCKTKFSTLECP